MMNPETTERRHETAPFRGIADSLKEPDRIQCEGFSEHGTDEALCALYTALAKAKAKFGPIVKDRTVTIETRTKDGGRSRYSFPYAPIENIIEATTPALSEEGLVVIQPLTMVERDGGPLARQVTILAGHGARLISTITYLPTMEMRWTENKQRVESKYVDTKGMAGQSTYFARYGLQRILGVNAEADDDDRPTREGETGATVQSKGQKQAPKADVPEDLKDAIRQKFKSLGLKGTSQIETIRKVTGGEPAEMTQESAVKLLTHLTSELNTKNAAAAQRQADEAEMGAQNG